MKTTTKSLICILSLTITTAALAGPPKMKSMGKSMSKSKVGRNFSPSRNMGKSMSQMQRPTMNRPSPSRTFQKPSVGKSNFQKSWNTRPNLQVQRPQLNNSFQPRPTNLKPFPGSFKPGVIKPGVVKPGVIRPGVIKPGVIKPGVIKPGVIKPGVIKPGVIKPGVIRPGVIKPGVIKPGVIKPGVIRPGIGLPFDPNNRPPGQNNPGTTQPPTADDHDHGHGTPHKPGLPCLPHGRVCLPPIVRCPPPAVCPPCVRAVCPGVEVIVIERTTEDILVEFLEEPIGEEAAPEFVLELASNTEVSLEIDGLDAAPGALVLEINGLGLPVEVLQFDAGIATIRVPSVGLSEALLGNLYVLNGDLQLVSSVAARLHPGDAG